MAEEKKQSLKERNAARRAEKQAAADRGENKLVNAMNATKENSLNAQLAGSNSLSEKNDTSLANGSDMAQLGDMRDKLGVQYGRETDPEKKKEIADQLKRIEQLVQSGKVNDGTSKFDEQPPAAENTSTAAAPQKTFGDRFARNNGIDDYYRDSLSDVYGGASDADKRILLLDAIGTMLKNVGKARPYIGTAFGQSQEARDVGDEKSLIQKGVEENWRKGLERRNTRLDTQLKQQLKEINFPANLNMEEQLQKIPNKVKVDLINRLSDVEYGKAFKAYMTQNPTAPIELAIKFLDAIAPDSLSLF